MKLTAIAALIAFVAGWTINGWRLDATYQGEKREAIERAVKQTEAIRAQDAALADGHEVVREQIRTVYRNREVEVVKNVPPDCDRCRLLPAGRVLLNACLAGPEACAAVQPDHPLPAAGGPAGAGDDAGPGAEAAGRGGPLPRVP